MGVRDDDGLDGGKGRGSMTTLVIIAYVPKREFLASLIFPRILRPRFASLGWNGARMPDIVSGSHNRVESPRFAHQVGPPRPAVATHLSDDSRDILY